MADIDVIAKTIWLAEFERAFSRSPSDPWENQANPIKDGHRNTARKLVESGVVTAEASEALKEFRRHCRSDMSRAAHDALSRLILALPASTVTSTPDRSAAK